MKGCPCAEGDPALNTAADMSVILTYWQLRDGVADHGFWGGLKYRVASALLGRAYRKARQALPWFDRGARQQLDELSALERESCPTLDEPADAFARLLALAAGEIAEEKRRRVTEQMLYHLGRWIYLTDAADDLRSDMKTGSYNPLALRFAPEDGRLRPADRQALAQTMDGSVQAMAAAFELWDFGVWAPILQVTFYQGLFQVGRAVLDGTFHRKNIREIEEAK